MSAFASRFYKKLGPRIMISVGLISAMLFTLLFMFADAHTNLWFIRVIMFCRGLSMSFAMIPIQAAAFSNIKPQETGRASSLFNTNRQVAASFGVAILGTILFQLLAVHTAPLIAYHITFIAAGLLGFIAVGFALSIKDRDAAASLGNTNHTAE
jgi:MFS family permease